MDRDRDDRTSDRRRYFAPLGDVGAARRCGANGTRCAVHGVLMKAIVTDAQCLEKSTESDRKAAALRSLLRLPTRLLLAWPLIACVNGSEGAGDYTAGQAVSSAQKAHFQVARQDPVLRATASVRTPFVENGQAMVRNGFEVRGPCGITFVTSNVAVTAAHCLPDSTSADVLDVRTYDVSAVADDRLRAAQELNVDQPYPNWQLKSRLTADDGYVETPIAGCSVIARCGPAPQIGVCELASNPLTVDVALIRCSGRPDDAPFVPVLEDDPELPLKGIYNVWYHEVYNIPDSLPANDPRVVHYTLYPHEPADNYHYLGRGPDGLEANQLLPLVSRPFASGAQRQALRLDEQGEMWNDLLTCHGTSGSGVFVNVDGRGPRYLGPTAEGYDADVKHPRLCQKASDVVAGKESSSFVAPKFVRALLEGNAP
jgi:hypothetical protein